MSFIYTERLALRPFERNHLTNTYTSWLNNADVCKLNGHGYFPYSMSKAEDYFAEVSTSVNIIVVAIHLKHTDEHIGNASIGDIDFINSSASLNILIGNSSCWGHGYAFEALNALLRHAFLFLNLNRVSCGTSIHNIGMQKVAKKLGMLQEGIKRAAMYKNGEYHDVIEYSILRCEYL